MNEANEEVPPPPLPAPAAESESNGDSQPGTLQEDGEVDEPTSEPLPLPPPKELIKSMDEGVVTPDSYRNLIITWGENRFL